MSWFPGVITKDSYGIDVSANRTASNSVTAGMNEDSHRRDQACKPKVIRECARRATDSQPSLNSLPSWTFTA